MRFKHTIITSIVCLLALFNMMMQPMSAKEEVTVPYVISSYNIQLDIKDNGLIHVNETFDISNCNNLQLTRMIPNAYKVNNPLDNTISEQTYSLSNVKVENHDFTEEAMDGSTNIHIILPKKSDAITLSYDVQMKDFMMMDIQMFYFTLFTGFEGSILSMNAEIIFPSTIPSQLQLLNDAGKLVSDYSSTITDNKVNIQSTKSIPFGTSLALQMQLPNDYFTYSFPMDYQMIAAIISIVLVCGSFLIYMNKEKSGNRKKLFMSHPPKRVPMILYGYIMDGYISPKDFIPLLVEWANQGYIWIEETNQDIRIILRQELPVHAPEYEKIFFDAIFGNKSVVNLYDLEHKDFTLIFEELKELVHHSLCNDAKRCIYSSDHINHQIVCCLLAGIPMFLAFSSTIYTETYDVLQAILWGVSLYFIIALSCIPWCILVKRYTFMTQKSRKSIFIIIAMMQVIILFVSGYILLLHQMNFLYIIIHILMTIFFQLDLFVLDRRTKHGSKLFKQVSAFDNFIHQSRVAQIDELMYQEPNYYYYMLPYALALDVVHIWSGKFMALMIQKPFWFMMPQSSSQSMYWVEPLGYALDDISLAILQKPNESKLY